MAAVELKPDALGFIFWPGSARYVRPEDVAAWTAGIPTTMDRVGVFVDASPEDVRRTAELAGLTVVQLHGRESPEVCGAVGGRVWKAVPWSRAEDEITRAYPVEAFMIDSGTPTTPGGTGQTGDWDTVARCVTACPRSVILAGGLNPANIVAAIERVRPWGVDVSTGVESEPRHKDVSRMKEFVSLCRGF
jgi:phosphoribosylanthranilate isomerase